ncbi:MAG: outer membrane protein [Sandaracinaceae bacterium]
MNTHRQLTYASLLAIAACLFLAAPAAAQQTNCQPGDLFCAELRIGPGTAGVRIGGADPAPPPPPQPPTVIVQPAPVQPAPPPQPPTVIVQPAYQPQPPPTTYVVQQPQPVRRVVQPRERYPYSSMGIRLNLNGIAAENVGMFGAGGGLRLRPIPHIALDVEGGVYGGVDYNGMDRVEVPVTATGRFFFNPQHRWQFYALVQVGVSFAHAEGTNELTGISGSSDYAHFGGGAGLGMEWRLGRNFALNLDGRAFIRQEITDGQPEFTEFRDGQWQSTDTSAGFAAQLGMTFYWGT